MGFYHIIPASKLAATYNVKTKTLTLYAEGVVKEYTYGFSFRQNKILGELIFVLGAWTGPIGWKTQPYKFNESFKNPLISIFPPTESLRIITEDNREGEIVPIHFIGLLQETDGHTATTASTEEASGSPAKLASGTKQINVLFKEPFTVSANANVPLMGSVDVNFDHKMLTLVDATIQNNDIVWTFNSLEMGDTQIVITTFGGVAGFIAQETIDIRIFVL